MSAERKAQVLIVDDSKSALHALHSYLQPLNVDITEAEDGVEGWEKFHEKKFDMVITDVDMPNMNGFELCEKIKFETNDQDIPVIILSAREDKQSIEHGFEVGAGAFVSKPNAAKELIPRVKELLFDSTLLQDRSVLVIEDSRSIRQAIARELENAGFKVLTAEDGVAALEIIEKKHPDLIVSDLNLPRLGGASLCRILQGNPELRSIPLVIMSVNSDSKVMRSLISHGAASYITKPFNLTQLVITIEKILSDRFRLLLEEKQHLRTEQRLTMDAISSLVNALEARDRYTRGHSENVARVAVIIGRQLGLDADELDNLELVGKLHDLGKIGVRDEVLLKEGKLSGDEYEHIKTHTTVAADILSPMNSMRPIAEAAASHHERWDGNGYPSGLAGEEIPLFGRIIAVADVYDALTSDRPYRKGMEQEKAVEMIRAMGGTQLCPSCLEAFMGCYEELED